MKVLFLLCLLSLVLESESSWRNWSPQHRDIKIKLDKLKLEISASYKNLTFQDEFKFGIDLGKTKHDLVDMNFKYTNSSWFNQNSLEFNFFLEKIVEFQITEEINVWEGDENTVLSTYPPAKTKPSWRPWQNETHYDSGITVFAFSATTIDGIFTVRVSIAATPVPGSSLKIDPNSVKIDIGIDNYPYQGQVGQSRLALVTEVRSLTESKQTGKKPIKDYRIIFDDNPDLPLGAFSWVPSVDIVVDDLNFTAVPVVAFSPQENDLRAKKFDIFFTFATNGTQASSLFWDPSIGLNYEELGPADPYCMGRVCGGAAIAITACLVALIVVVPVVVLLVVTYKKRNMYQRLA